MNVQYMSIEFISIILAIICGFVVSYNIQNDMKTMLTNCQK